MPARITTRGPGGRNLKTRCRVKGSPALSHPPAEARHLVSPCLSLLLSVHQTTPVSCAAVLVITGHVHHPLPNPDVTSMAYHTARPLPCPPPLDAPSARCLPPSSAVAPIARCPPHMDLRRPPHPRPQSIFPQLMSTPETPWQPYPGAIGGHEEGGQASDDCLSRFSSSKQPPIPLQLDYLVRLP